MTKSSRIFIIITLLLFSPLSLCYSETPALLSTFSTEKSTLEAPVIRERTASYIDLPLVRAASKAQIESFTINLFDDAPTVLPSFTITSREIFDENSATLRGYAYGDPNSAIVLSIVENAVDCIYFTSAGEVYNAKTDSNGEISVQQIDQDASDGICGASGEANTSIIGGRCGPGAASQIENVDVMILYTALAQSDLAAYGGSGIKARINQAIGLANEAFERSGSFVNLNLRHSEMLSFDQGLSRKGDMLYFVLALEQVPLVARTYRNIETSFTKVQRLRDALGIDLIQFWPATHTGGLYDPDSGATLFGISRTMTSETHDLYGFGCSVSGAKASTIELTSPHEFGHSFGCWHDRDATDVIAAIQQHDPITNPLLVTNYCFGYCWQTGGTSTRRDTIMGTCYHRRVLNYSNPNISYDGVPTGIDIAEPLAAANALTINETAPCVADFRAPASSLVIKDKFGSVAAVFMESGDLCTFGSVVEQSGSSELIDDDTVSELLVKSTAGDIVARLQEGTNILYLAGSIEEFASSPLTPSETPAFYVKNKTGASVAAIDNAGNLILLGESKKDFWVTLTDSYDLKYAPSTNLSLDIAIQEYGFHTEVLRVVVEVLGNPTWTYEGMVSGACDPDTAPSIHSTGPWVFEWSNPPVAPAHFQVQLGVPSGVTGTKTIELRGYSSLEGLSTPTKNMRYTIKAM